MPYHAGVSTDFCPLPAAVIIPAGAFPTNEPSAESSAGDTPATPERGSLSPAERRKQRREYNRQYMWEWRRQHGDEVRERQREYAKKAYMRRKLAAATARPGKDEPRLCAFGCGQPATQTVERISEFTWEPIQVAYCGNC